MSDRSYITADKVQADLVKADGLFSPESETAVVAAILASPEACQDHAESLSFKAFGDPVLGRVWRIAGQLLRDGRAMDPALIRDALGADSGFAAWGGIDQLLTLRDIGTALGVGDHVEAILDRSQRRLIRALAEDVGARASNTADGDAASLLADLERGAGEIAAGCGGADHWHDAGAMIERALDSAEAKRGAIEFPSGIHDLDMLTNGLHRGEMTLLGGRPGMGKSIGGMTYAKAIAQAGKGVLFYSLEMAEDPMGLRLACDLVHDRHARSYSGRTSNITMDQITKDALEPWQRDKLREAAATIRNWPLKFDTRPSLTMAQIEAFARRAFRRWERAGIEPGLIVIDHLGKVRPSKDRRGSMQQEVADVSNDAMTMAKRLDVPVLGLVQLNRQVEGRGDDKRPILSDLRQAGELEQDARQVIFMYRPEYYLRESLETASAAARAELEGKLMKVRNQLYWIVEKNSSGPRGQVLSFCEVACSAIRPWDGERLV